MRDPSTTRYYRLAWLTSGCPADCKITYNGSNVEFISWIELINMANFAIDGTSYLPGCVAAQHMGGRSKCKLPKRGHIAKRDGDHCPHGVHHLAYIPRRRLNPLPWPDAETDTIIAIVEGVAAPVFPQSYEPLQLTSSPKADNKSPSPPPPCYPKASPGPGICAGSGSCGTVSTNTMNQCDLYLKSCTGSGAVCVVPPKSPSSNSRRRRRSRRQLKD